MWRSFERSPQSEFFFFSFSHPPPLKFNFFFFCELLYLSTLHYDWRLNACMGESAGPGQQQATPSPFGGGRQPPSRLPDARTRVPSSLTKLGSHTSNASSKIQHLVFCVDFEGGSAGFIEIELAERAFALHAEGVTESFSAKPTRHRGSRSRHSTSDRCALLLGAVGARNGECGEELSRHSLRMQRLPRRLDGAATAFFFFRRRTEHGSRI